MDPLSISVSAITLLQVAGKISSSLWDFIQSVRTADPRLIGLSEELGTLTGVLTSVDKTLKECRNRPLALAPMDDDLWRQSGLALADCQTTLHEMEDLVDNIRTTIRPGAFLRTARVAVHLNLHQKDIEAFQERLYKSKWALQTVLAVITVSLSLRGDASQNLILFELGKLKVSLEQALQAATRSKDGGSNTMADHSDSRIARNLHHLARAAQHFHSAASAAASTIIGSSGSEEYPHLQSDAAMSVIGHLSPTKREQVEAFLQQGHHQHPTSHNVDSQSSLSSARHSILEESISDFQGIEDICGHDAELRLLFRQGLEDLALESIIHHDFPQAEVFLRDALSDSRGPDRGQLQMKLAVCYLFQGKWRLVEPLILGLPEASMGLSIYTMFHALSLVYLSEFSLDFALKTCERALLGRKRLLGASHPRYYETFALLAIIYDMMGDPVRGEIIRRSLPSSVLYHLPPTAVQYLVEHPNILKKIFGERFPEGWRMNPASSNQDQARETPHPNAISSSQEERPNSSPGMCTRQPSLRDKLQMKEKLDLDTSKEMVVDMTTNLPSSTGNSSDIPPAQPDMPRRSLSIKVSRMFGSVRMSRAQSQKLPPVPRTKAIRHTRSDEFIGAKQQYQQAIPSCPSSTPNVSLKNDERSVKTSRSFRRWKTVLLRRRPRSDSLTLSPAAWGYSELSGECVFEIDGTELHPIARTFSFCRPHVTEITQAPISNVQDSSIPGHQVSSDGGFDAATILDGHGSSSNQQISHLMEHRPTRTSTPGIHSRQPPTAHPTAMERLPPIQTSAISRHGIQISDHEQFSDLSPGELHSFLNYTEADEDISDTDSAVPETTRKTRHNIRDLSAYIREDVAVLPLYTQSRERDADSGYDSASERRSFDSEKGGDGGGKRNRIVKPGGVAISTRQRMLDMWRAHWSYFFRNESAPILLE